MKKIKKTPGPRATADSGSGAACSDSRNVDELFSCIAKTMGQKLPTRADVSAFEVLVNLYGLSVAVQTRQGFRLYAEVDPDWQGLPIAKLESLSVTVRDDRDSN